MGEDKIELGTGTLYFIGPEGPSPLGCVYEGTVEPTRIEEAPEGDGVYIRGNIFEEITLSIQLTAESARGLAAAFVGLTDAMYTLCPNNRVVHLAKYGKKERTRKKNRRRACKILKKEAR